MDKLTGIIANINNKYVILNDKHFIVQNKLYNTLLPNDLVEYQIIDNKIYILKILKREPQILFGIVKDINTTKTTFCFPVLPKFFSLELITQPNFKLYSVAIIKIGLEFINILHVFDSIKNRLNDKDLFINLYEEQSNLCSIIPNYKESKCYYTEEYKDLTDLYTFNVDPTKSKDFDDAISIYENKIYIHIVDANEQIDKLSLNDINSFKHSFTLYLPEQVRNILPKNLAEDKLSLIEGKERKTITIEYLIDVNTQDIISHSIYPSIIRIKKRYDYNEFNNCLNEFPTLLNFYNRWKRVTFNIPHLKLDIDKFNGKLINHNLEYFFDDAHKIIETLMVLTNLTVSEHVGSLIPQRYHSKIKLDFELKTFTGNSVIDSILTIKKFKPANYDTLHKGHFGLGLNSYTHFTSPIRRYFDVIIHRLLSGTIYENIDEILNHINMQEIYIEKLTDYYTNLKLLTYFEDNLDKVWKGYIMSINEIGITVVLQDNLYELFIFDTNKKNQKKIYEDVNIKIKNINWFTLCVKAELI